METLENKVISRIYGNGRGWVFSQIDFLDIGVRPTIDSALSRLEKKGTIVRALRGIYYYPQVSLLIDEPMPPEISRVALALARKFGWDIVPSGETALNYFGLSTQVQAKYLYITNGVSRTYRIQGTELRFKKLLKESEFRHPESSILVQALRALGKDHFTSDNLSKIKSKISPDKYALVLKDTKNITAWIYEAIREICKS